MQLPAFYLFPSATAQATDKIAYILPLFYLEGNQANYFEIQA